MYELNNPDNFTYDCQCWLHHGVAVDLPDKMFPDTETVKAFGFNPEWCLACNREARMVKKGI